MVGSSRGQPVRLLRGGRRCPVGAAARRGQRRSHGDARSGSTTAASRRRSASAWPRTRTSRFRLFGFGHRVYKNYDPRAKILKASLRPGVRHAEAQGPAPGHRPQAGGAGAGGSVLRGSQAVSERRLLQRHPAAGDGHSDQHVHRLFAIGRLPGWIAQWKEQHDDPGTKIVRPRQIYTGPTVQDYVPMEERY